MGFDFPKVLDAVRDVSRSGFGEVFSKGSLLPCNTRRIETQAELLKFVAECNKQVKLAEINAEVTMYQCDKESELDKMKLMYDTFIQLVRCVDGVLPEDYKAIRDALPELKL